MATSDKFSRDMNHDAGRLNGKALANIRLEALNASQVMAIDRAVAEIGDYGEIHLIVKQGRLRFIGKLKTEAVEP